MNKFLITGLFRSGTTFLSRALNSHSEITSVSDPFFEFFKYLRNKSFEHSATFDPKSPLMDYFDSDFSQVEEYLDVCLKIKLSKEDILTLSSKISNYCQPYSPKIIPYLNKLKADSAFEVFEQCFNIIKEAYGHSKLLGIKEVWSDEFVGPLNKQMGFKTIQIIRDPRAIIASNRRSVSGAYPILFLIRQWRKSVAFSIINNEHKNHLVIKYEDLVNMPIESFKKICQHLEIRFEHSLIDSSKYLDGFGNAWQQNSSHGTSSKINKSFMDKWQEVLPVEELQNIEYFCGPELDFMRYPRKYKKAPKNIMSTFNHNHENIAEWIRSYDFNMNIDRKERELQRIQILLSDSMDWSGYFFNKNVYEALKNGFK